MNKELIEKLKAWEQEGKTALAADIAPSSADPEKRTIDCVWFTGGDVERYSWSEGAYMLRFDPRGADLSRLNAGAPVCDNHWMSSVEDQRGVVLKAWKDGDKYKGTLQFSRSTELTGPRPKADALWQDIQDGIVSKFSMGVELIEFADTRDKDNRLKLRTALKWRPFELSLAPIPADFGTTTLSRQLAPRPKAALASVRARELAIARLL